MQYFPYKLHTQLMQRKNKQNHLREKGGEDLFEKRTSTRNINE
jgi:hypothetical protein